MVYPLPPFLCKVLTGLEMSLDLGVPRLVVKQRNPAEAGCSLSVSRASRVGWGHGFGGCRPVTMTPSRMGRRDSWDFLLVERFGNYGILQEEFEGDDFQGALVGSFEDDRASGTGFLDVKPATGADAPAIPGTEPREAEVRHRGGKIVAEARGGGEEFCCNDAAYRVQAEILRRGVTAGVAEKAGGGIGAADFEGLAENVFLRMEQPWV